MSKVAVLEYPDPRLKMPSDQVTEFDASVSTLVENLLDTLYASTGIALSAPQIDDRRRVLVMDLSEDRSSPEVYINPEIVRKAMLGIVEESCLSLPGLYANVVRATKVQVRAQDAEGNVFERTLDGMHAVCLQHEMDHLDGILFIDRLSFLRRLRARAALKKLEKLSEQGADGRDAA